MRGWYVTLNGRHAMTTAKKKCGIITFGPKKNGVTGEREQEHSEELDNLYSSLIPLG
jgi:hypothetical protein